MLSKILIKQMVDALVAKSRRRTRKTAKSVGESSTDSDPTMSEWSNPG